MEGIEQTGEPLLGYCFNRKPSGSLSGPLFGELCGKGLRSGLSRNMFQAFVVGCFNSKLRHNHRITVRASFKHVAPHTINLPKWSWLNSQSCTWCCLIAEGHVHLSQAATFSKPALGEQELELSDVASYNAWAAYSDSKLANVVFAKERSEVNPKTSRLGTQLPAGALLSFCWGRVPLQTQPDKKGCGLFFPMSTGHLRGRPQRQILLSCLFVAGTWKFS